MKRRQVLVAVGGSLMTLSAGCLGNDDEDDDDTAEFSESAFKKEYFPDHDELTVITEDEFPDQIEGGHRGAAEEPFIVPYEDHKLVPERWDVKGWCASRMNQVLFAELQDRYPDATPQVRSDTDRDFPEEVDGYAIYVRYSVMVQNGDVVEKPVDNYREFVTQIPSRGHLLDWDDDILCTMPIYVRYRVREVDHWEE